jgi:hypothetical protein
MRALPGCVRALVAVIVALGVPCLAVPAVWGTPAAAPKPEAPAAGAIREFPTMQFARVSGFELANAISAALNVKALDPYAPKVSLSVPEVLASSGVAFRMVFAWAPHHGDEWFAKADIEQAFRVAGASCNLGPDWEGDAHLRDPRNVWRRAMSSVNIGRPLIASRLVEQEPWRWGLIGGYQTDGVMEKLFVRLSGDEKAREVPVGQYRLLQWRWQGEGLRDAALLRAVLARLVGEASQPARLEPPAEVVGAEAWARWAAALRDGGRFTGLDAARIAHEGACNQALLGLVTDARAAAAGYLMGACRFAPKGIYEIRVAAGTYDQTARELRKLAAKTPEEAAKLIADPAWRGKLAAALDACAARDQEALGLLRLVLGSMPEGKGS